MLVTYRGNIFDYKDIHNNKIDSADIIHSLARQNRFIGHSSRAYSVAEHLIHCYFMACELNYSPRLRLLTLIHDFTEAYMGDCPTPLKALLPEYIAIEAKVEEAILNHFGLSPITEEEYMLIKRIDYTMLVIEMRDLTLHEYENFISDLTYLEVIDNPEFDLFDENTYSTESLQHELSSYLDEAIKNWKRGVA